MKSHSESSRYLRSSALDTNVGRTPSSAGDPLVALVGTTSSSCSTGGRSSGHAGFICGHSAFVRVCVLALLALPAFAQQWVKLSTPHFELYTSAGEKKGRDTILYFEQVRSFFRR